MFSPGLEVVGITNQNSNQNLLMPFPACKLGMLLGNGFYPQEKGLRNQS